MEIERKFLINKLPRLWEFKSTKIEQYYISLDPEVRIRKGDDKYKMTIKSEGNMERSEVELSISEEQYLKLKDIKSNRFINKTRYLIPSEKHLYELDIYDDLNGLMTVEVEFSNLDDAKNFTIPCWFSDEITNIKEFKNKNLATYGLPQKLDCIFCKGKGSNYDRESMARNKCDWCNGEGSVDINTINIGSYNKHLN